MFIGIVGALMFLISVFMFSQRNWKGGLLWLLVGTGLIALLTYMDKPSANLLPRVLNGCTKPVAINVSACAGARLFVRRRPWG